MCQLNSAFVKTPKKVGDKLEAGTYAKNDDGTPLKNVVYLKGYNPGNGQWKTFAQTTPDQATGWAGMPLVALADEHVGTWRMSFSGTDNSGNSCGIGPYDLVVTKEAVPIFLTSDKIAIQKGDSVTFSGRYKPGAEVNIYADGLVANHITKVKCDANGDFKTLVSSLDLAAGTHEIRACSAGGFFECSLFPDNSNAVYITVHERLQCTPGWHCIEPLNGMESDGCGHTRENAACNPPGNPPGNPPAGSNGEGEMILAALVIVIVIIFLGFARRK